MRSKRGCTLRAAKSVSTAPRATAKPPSAIAATWRRSSGSSSPVGKVHTRDLEEPDLLVPHVDVVARGGDEAVQERRAENRVLGGERVGEAQRLRVRIGRGQAERVRLREARADEHVLGKAAQALIGSQLSEHGASHRQRERDLLQAVDPRDLLDEVDLARDVARAPGRHGHRPVGDVEAQALQRAALLVGRDLQPDHPVDAVGAERDDGRLGERALHVGVPRPLRAGELDDELRRERGGLRRQVRVDAFLPAVRAFGAQSVALRAREDADRLEVRGLEEDVRRPLAHLGLLAAHDPGEGDRALGVGDHQILRVELARSPVEGRELLSRPRPPDDDLPAAQRVEIEGVERIAEGEHHVVRDVDDVGDRAHAGSRDPRLEPRRRGRDCHVAEEPADVARAALVVLDGHVGRLRAGLPRIAAGRRRRARRRRGRPPRARSRTPTGSRGGCASSRSRGPPRRAGARRPAACPARRGRRGRGCRCGRTRARARAPRGSSRRKPRPGAWPARGGCRPGAPHPGARPRRSLRRRSSRRRRRSGAARPRRRRRGKAGAGRRSDAFPPRRRGRL